MQWNPGQPWRMALHILVGKAGEDTVLTEGGECSFVCQEGTESHYSWGKRGEAT